MALVHTRTALVQNLQSVKCVSYTNNLMYKTSAIHHRKSQGYENINAVLSHISMLGYMFSKGKNHDRVLGVSQKLQKGNTD